MDLLPHLIVDATLYSTLEGGRSSALKGTRYGCPCKLSKDDDVWCDGWLLLNGQTVLPGATRRLGIHFGSEESIEIFRAAGKFYLWEGHVIGEAVVVTKSN